MIPAQWLSALMAILLSVLHHPHSAAMVIFAEDPITAVSVFRCENRSGDPHAVSPTGDYGLTQINAQTWAEWLDAQGFDFWSNWHHPIHNLLMAKAIWDHGSTNRPKSFYHWSCYRSITHADN